MQQWRMNASADNSFSCQSIFQWKSISLRAQRKKIMSNFPSNVKYSLWCGWFTIFSNGQQTLNQFSVVVHAKKTHIFSRQ